MAENTFFPPVLKKTMAVTQKDRGFLGNTASFCVWISTHLSHSQVQPCSLCMNAACPFAIKQILEDSIAPVHCDVARAMECKLIEHQQKLKKSTYNLVYKSNMM